MILMWRMWLMRFLKKCTDFFSINYWVSWWWLGLFYWRLLFFYCQLWSHSTISVRTTCRARLWEPNTLLCNNLMETVSEDCTANIIFFNDPLAMVILWCHVCVSPVTTVHTSFLWPWGVIGLPKSHFRSHCLCRDNNVSSQMTPPTQAMQIGTTQGGVQQMSSQLHLVFTL